MLRGSRRFRPTWRRSWSRAAGRSKPFHRTGAAAAIAVTFRDSATGGGGGPMESLVSDSLTTGAAGFTASAEPRQHRPLDDAGLCPAPSDELDRDVLGRGEGGKVEDELSAAALERLRGRFHDAAATFDRHRSDGVLGAR